ncbi:hypothetical protein A2U01_0043041 [Trifolium medium]|uniref:Uncharacterized protein n=1 Tax=Trifolium medium TaxID=97028 RepID=A0A392QDR1_9FABA|nr:hypothetical protein [Trifolium medium]
MTDIAMGDGSCVGDGTKLVNGSDEAILAEALGQLEAVEWIERLQIQRAAVEMDAQATDLSFWFPMSLKCEEVENLRFKLRSYKSASRSY